MNYCFGHLLLVYYFWFAIIENSEGLSSTAIPYPLQNCYRSNVSLNSKPPFTINLLLELIRKIEMDNRHALDIRILSTSMLHGVKFDGIRRALNAPVDDFAISYRASGIEFNKYKLIVDYLTSGESLLFPYDSLTTSELCFLHQLISNNIDPWLRGDEAYTCHPKDKMPKDKLQLLDDIDKISSCPIKGGTIKTKWGSISAGHIIAAIASVLHQSIATFERVEEAININNNATILHNNRRTTKTTNDVSTNKSINNINVDTVWVSTIAGDLAGVILNQATATPLIGNDGFWNNTLLPNVYYLKNPKWDMTEADILGGIDGVAIAEKIKKSPISNNLRLSQVIDMYYLERSWPLYDRSIDYKPTNRSVSLNILLGKIKLEEQVIGASKLLQQIGVYDTTLQENDLKALAPIVVEKFKQVASHISRTYDNVEYVYGKDMKSSIETIVIVDGTYDFYTTKKFLHILSEATQVSYYGSRIGVINGQSGNWMVNVTKNLFEMFENLDKSAYNWPSGISLVSSLETILYYYQYCNNTDRPIGKSILVISNNRLTTIDFDKSLKAIKSLKNSYPEVNIIYVTSENSGFNKEFIKSDNDYILISSQNVLSMVEQVSNKLSNISGHIVNFYCNNKSQVQYDYITPDFQSSYEIRHEYIQRAAITTKFRSNYGDVIICGQSCTKKFCKNLTVNGEITFDFQELTSEYICNWNFIVTVDNTNIGCLDLECRYPHQVKLEISWSSSGFIVKPCGLILMLVILSLNKLSFSM